MTMSTRLLHFARYFVNEDNRYESLTNYRHQSP